jgi:RNA polymerase sigma factor (sigma-70 family)
MVSAMKQLLQKEEGRLLGLFLRKTNDPQESRDLLQDLYVSVLANPDSFALAEDQAAWLFRAAYNRATDWYRNRSRKKEISLDESNGEGLTFGELLTDFEDLEDRFFREALYDALYEAVEALPEKLRSVIRAQSLGERTFRELSEEWGIPVGTLLSRKREAVRLLREALDDFSDVWYETIHENGGII